MDGQVGHTHQFAEDVAGSGVFGRFAARHAAVAPLANDPALSGQGVDEVDAPAVIQQTQQLRPQSVEVARLNLDQQVTADDVDDVAAEFDLELVARLRQVFLQPGMEGALGQLADVRYRGGHGILS